MLRLREDITECCTPAQVSEETVQPVLNAANFLGVSPVVDACCQVTYSQQTGLPVFDSVSMCLTALVRNRACADSLTCESLPLRSSCSGSCSRPRAWRSSSWQRGTRFMTSPRR